ncbi:hypothetical protein [Nitrosomonas marina]|uniref:Cytochrome c domain-containing protein n=1 Tax=Nitrosomonas marina TaxID=917 RepID=A0A1H8AQ85_9PROT|nr:hypothetical protein [Nitrosomonas marina]SEM71978.1 hypothetical protein SAMN05216325_101235 [Nitrosomonas marina]
MSIAKVLKRTFVTLFILALIIVTAIILAVRAWVLPDYSKIGEMKDEAILAGRMADSFPAAAEPYFVEMDKGVLKQENADIGVFKQWAEVLKIAPEEVREAAIKGQNSWIVWTGGNDRFWDEMANKYTFGTYDLLKILSSHPSQGYGRDTRWAYLGLVNEPCFEKATEPDEYGLWLDKRIVDPANGCPEDPFADAEKYPGVAIGARGKNIPVGSFYGEPSGIVGLRLFPNPNFDEAAAKKWKEGQASGKNNDGYYTNPDFFYDKELVRPYRVGMSCAFCHVGPSPVNPPADPENPKWSELNSNPGAQYFWVNRIFFWDNEPRDPGNPHMPAKQEHNFIYQLFHTNPPGALDTSLISTDYINNPRTMNAVYSLGSRLLPTLRWGGEQLTGDELDNKQFNDYPQTNELGAFWDKSTGQIKTARVLKDGADSVGVLGALNRVYLNIGLFSEEWLTHFYPVIGTQKITPIRIADAQKNSSYWNATEDQTADMAIFFLVSASPDDLKDAPDGENYLSADNDVLDRGRIVFAENCAACHSSKIPESPPESGIDTGECVGGGNGANYRKCWDKYWEWTQTDEFKEKMKELVFSEERDETCPEGKDPFLCDNFLSTERRIPVDLLQTNACSPLATNGLKGDIWDNFTSTSYKQLPAAGELVVHHPVSGEASTFQPLGNGRGYTRPASLISLWSTAPFLLNNSVGHIEYYEAAEEAYGNYSGAAGEYAYEKSDYSHESKGYQHMYPDTYQKAYGGADPYNPGVSSRMAVFYDSINKMLNPDQRRMDGETATPVPGYIYRTTAASCVKIPAGYIPGAKTFGGLLNWIAPWAFEKNGDFKAGPFPEGMPVNLLVNTKVIPDHDEEMGFDHLMKLARIGLDFLSVAKELGGTCTPEELVTPAVKAHAKSVFYNSNLVNSLLDLSKCPDYVVNRGHYFGVELSDDDKQALIAYLKTF